MRERDGATGSWAAYGREMDGLNFAQSMWQKESSSLFILADISTSPCLVLSLTFLVPGWQG